MCINTSQPHCKEESSKERNAAPKNPKRQSKTPHGTHTHMVRRRKGRTALLFWGARRGGGFLVGKRSRPKNHTLRRERALHNTKGRVRAGCGFEPRRSRCGPGDNILTHKNTSPACALLRARAAKVRRFSTTHPNKGLGGSTCTSGDHHTPQHTGNGKQRKGHRAGKGKEKEIKNSIRNPCSSMQGALSFHIYHAAL